MLFVFIGRDADAVSFDGVDAIFAEGVVADGVFGGRHEFEEFGAQFDELAFGDVGFEDAFLYAVTIVADRALDAVSAAIVDYIIANEEEHGKTIVI